MGLKKTIKDLPFVWRWYFNAKPSANYLFGKLGLTGIPKKVVRALREDGISSVQFKDLLPADLWEELNQQKFEHSEEMQSDKSYAFFHLPRVYDANSVFARIMEHPEILNIASAYFKMSNPQLAYYDVWENIPSDEEAKNAQLWHRDRDDKKILKIFIYLKDVEAQNGPFYYAPKTHLEGRIKNKPQFFLENNKVERSTDEQMRKVVPEKDWIIGTAKKGTIVFADTHGYHKGGFVKEGTRLLFVGMYLSPSSKRNRFHEN